MKNRPPFTRHALFIILSVALSACGGGGGGLDLPSVITVGNTPSSPKPPVPPATPPVPPKTSGEKFMQPALGYALAIPVRDIYDGKQDHVPLNVDNIEELQADGKSVLTKRVQAYHRNKKLDVRIPPQIKDQSAYQYVQAGWIFAGFSPYEREEVKDKGVVVSSTAKGLGYLYYLGSTPATSLPTAKLTYQGHWDFVTDVQKVRDTGKVGGGGSIKVGGGSSFSMDTGFGNDIAATSFAETTWGQARPRKDHHTAEFEADFANKTLTGKLNYHKQIGRFTPPETIPRYTVDARINGNRFHGSAIAVNTKAGNGDFNLFSKHASNRLEGGFFGTNAEELVGKFISDDNSLFGVFAGKQTAVPASVEHKFDARYIDLSLHDGINPQSQARELTLPYHGNLNTILLNGKRFELADASSSFTLENNQRLDNGQSVRVTSCCSERNHVKIGLIQKTTPPALVATNEQKEEAREKLKAEIAVKRQELETLLDKVIVANKATDEQRKKIMELVFSGFDKAGRQYAQLSENKAFNRRLRRMINDEDSDVFLVEVFDKGEKYDLRNEANLDLAQYTQYPANITPDHSILGVFLLGERTAISDLPSGVVKYRGTWQGRINGAAQWSSNAGNNPYSSKSEFTADFANKTLSGSLTEEKGIAPLFTINAKINGNGFEGTATSREIDLDPAKQQNKNILPAMTVDNVKGAFYGPKAQELGGGFSFNANLRDNRGKVMGGVVFDGVKE